MRLNPQFPADLVIFTEEILNVKLHFLCSGLCFHITILTLAKIQVFCKKMARNCMRKPLHPIYYK